MIITPYQKGSAYLVMEVSIICRVFYRNRTKKFPLYIYILKNQLKTLSLNFIFFYIYYSFFHHLLLTLVTIRNKIRVLIYINAININKIRRLCKHEKQQRFSIRKYAVGTASVLIGFAFQVQTVAADGVTLTTTENQPTIHTVSDSPQASENRTEETLKTKLQSEAPKNVETETPSTDKVASLSKPEEKPQEEGSSTPSDKEELVSPTSAPAENGTSDKKEEMKEADSKESNIDKTNQPKADKDKPTTEEGKERAATENEKLAKRKIVSIDAGRKYFSPEQLKEIIDKAKEYGYTDLHLLVGNDSLRFMLDDMSMKVGDKTYSSDDVKRAIENGTNAYYDDQNGNHLTESQMTDFINYAKDKGTGVIPTVNSPGHMDAMLVVMEKLGFKNPQANFDKVSKTTMDLENQETVGFTKSLISKYMNYFADKSKIFNYGTDEYANDATNAQGWYYLKCNKFADYSNTLAAMAKERGLQPMAFNDGFYYEDKDDAEFDKDVLISYWSKGWWGYNLASPQYLASKGYKFLNTNGDWYYVLGNHKPDEAYPLSKDVENSGKVPFNQLASTKYPEVDLPTVRSMLAIWADKSSAEYKEEKIFKLMTTFADHNKDYFRANYNALRELLSKIPTNLDGYSAESLAALKAAKDGLNLNLNRSKQAELDEAQDCSSRPQTSCHSLRKPR